MARNMTTVQQQSTIRFGSGKFEVGETEDNMIDLGAMNGVAFEETWDEIQVTSDNAGVITAGIRNHKAALKGDLMEINLKNLALIRGGIDKYDEVPAAEGKKAAVRLLSGGVSNFIPRVARVTNYNDRGEAFRITVFKATTATGLSIAFPGAEDENAASTPIEMIGTPDVERDPGEQLFEIYDEQGVVPTP